MVLVLLCLFVPGWLPTLLTHMLMLWPMFSNFASEHDAAYRVAFFFVQSVLATSAFVLLSKRYKTALWVPQPSWHRGIVAFIIILLPLLLFHLSACVRGIQATIALLRFGIAGTQALDSIFNEVWSLLAYGPSPEGVFCSPILFVVVPPLEEVVFTGFVVNVISKRYGLTAAVIGASACFALVHAVQFGIGVHLISLFFAGMTYAMIRIFSGSLLLAVVGHWIINAVIFLPKWVLAVIHFTHT
jgi:membrane protease YdiL (CAAX protease family)